MRGVPDIIFGLTREGKWNGTHWNTVLVSFLSVSSFCREEEKNNNNNFERTNFGFTMRKYKFNKWTSCGDPIVVAIAPMTWLAMRMSQWLRHYCPLYTDGDSLVFVFLSFNVIFFIKYYNKIKTYSIREIAVIIIIIIIRIIQPRQLSDAVFGIIVLHGVISHPFFFFWLYIVLPIHHHHYHNHNITLIPIRSKRPPIFFRIYIYIISNTFICFDTLTY